MADTRCTIVQNEDPDAPTTEELQLELDKKYKLDCLKKLWKYFESTKRIVYEDAENICQPIMVPQKTQDDIFTVAENIDAARATLSARRDEVVEESGWGSSGLEMSTASPPTSNQESTTFGSSSWNAGVESQGDNRQWRGGTQQWSNPNQPPADVSPLSSVVEDNLIEADSQQLGEDTHTSTDFTSHAPHQLTVRESSSADPPAMLSQDTQASNMITPDVPQKLHIHESPSAEFPEVLSEEYIGKACVTVWNRLLNEGGQESF